MTPPDDTMIDFLLKWLWAPLLGLFSWGWNHHTKRVDDLRVYTENKVRELRAHVDKSDGEIVFEVTRQRDVSTKIFDRLSEQDRIAASRHIELVSLVHTSLAGKADKK